MKGMSERSPSIDAISNGHSRLSQTRRARRPPRSTAPAPRSSSVQDRRMLLPARTSAPISSSASWMRSKPCRSNSLISRCWKTAVTRPPTCSSWLPAASRWPLVKTRWMTEIIARYVREILSSKSWVSKQIQLQQPPSTKASLFSKKRILNPLILNFNQWMRLQSLFLSLLSLSRSMILRMKINLLARAFPAVSKQVSLSYPFVSFNS